LTFSGKDPINYVGQGSILATGNVSLGTNLVTVGNNSFPQNIIGVMTPKNINFPTSQLTVMGLFYGENATNPSKQTVIIGSIVCNYFDLSQVPKIYQVPEAANHLPPGMIGGSGGWTLKLVAWQLI
jgi:hypothetical protein